jgi:hypothetical protein
MPSAGCTVASGVFSFSGLAPSLAMLLLFARARRRAEGRRRRLVTGALEGLHAAPSRAPGSAAVETEADSAMAGAAAQVPLRR